MGILLRGADTVYALRFLRLLTMPWEKTEAFKVGIVDDKGKKLKKPDTPEERGAYSMFHRLVFNLRRLIQKVPGGGSKIASYLAAFWLIRETTDVPEHQLQYIFEKAYGLDFSKVELKESFFVDNDNALFEGTYRLRNDIMMSAAAEVFAQKGSLVEALDCGDTGKKIFGTPVYKVLHVESQQNIYVVATDLIAESVTAVASIPVSPGVSRRVVRRKQAEDTEDSDD